MSFNKVTRKSSFGDSGTNAPKKKKNYLQSRILIANAYTLIAALYCAFSTFLFYYVVGNIFLSVVHLLALIIIIANYFILIQTNNNNTVDADNTMMKQVMINLLSNAIKYSSKSEKPYIEIKSHYEENEVVYSISDNGVGFNNQYAHKLFGVFQRAPAGRF
jgi:signal transduction histidine kinase